jgi:ATP-binding cassette, subfamily B, bacterial
MANREFRLEHEHRYDRRGPVRWILSHLARYPHFPLLALLAAIFNNFFYGEIQVNIGRAFDLISTPGWTRAALAALAMTAVGLAIGQGITGLLRNYSVEFVAARIERDARDELYAGLLGKSQTFHGRQRIGDVMARTTNDVHMLNLMFSPGLMLILDSAMGIVMPLILIANIDRQLLLVPAFFLVGLAITLANYNRRLNPVSAAIRERFGDMNAGLAEAIAGIEVVKSNVQERYEWSKFTGSARLVRDVNVKQGEVQALYWPTLVFAFAWAAALLQGLLLWRAGTLTLGQAIAYLGLVGTLRFPTNMSLFTFNLVQLGQASAERILEMVNTETELDENQHGVSRPMTGEVTFDHVSFGYDSALRAGAEEPGLPDGEAIVGNGHGEPRRGVLRDVSFAARPGETIAIVGQTGSGKSTLTRLINRIFDAERGKVLVDGVDVRDWNLESLRSQISFIEQDPFLFSRTIRENIAFGKPDATEAEILAASQAAQAHDFIMSFKDGYDTEIGERGVTLSGGQRQRIAIARAFLTDPRILILDDSTSAIDSATEDQIQRAMHRISEARTTFLITHRLSQIRWADRILVLRRGTLVDQGTHDELLERSPDYARIFAARATAGGR